MDVDDGCVVVIVWCNSLCLAKKRRDQQSKTNKNECRTEVRESAKPRATREEMSSKITETSRLHFQRYQHSTRVSLSLYIYLAPNQQDRVSSSLEQTLPHHNAAQKSATQSVVPVSILLLRQYALHHDSNSPITTTTKTRSGSFSSTCRTSLSLSRSFLGKRQLNLPYCLLCCCGLVVLEGDFLQVPRPMRGRVGRREGRCARERCFC